MAVGAIRVEGLRELKWAFNRIDRQLADDLEGVMKDAAEPVRSTAEQLAIAKIRNIGVRWSGMRTGIAGGGSVLYVAPKARRSQGGDPRPKLAPLLLEKAMIPALDQNREEVVRRVERMLDRVILGF
jgi:hypothetical protein